MRRLIILIINNYYNLYNNKAIIFNVKNNFNSTFSKQNVTSASNHIFYGVFLAFGEFKSKVLFSS